MNKTRRSCRAALLAGLLVGCSGGSSWVEQDVPEGAPMTSHTLWVFGEDDVWLGGSSIWHYDGASWTETAPPSSSFVANFWGFAPDDLWAVGDSVALHWDGASWTDRSPTDVSGFNALWAIWGASSSELWIANQDNSRVFHYDGTKWTRTVLRFVQANAIWGSSASDIWLVGLSAPYHYDGTSWTEHDEDDDSPRHATGLWGSGPSDVWAVGGGPEIVHFDGSAWTGLEEIDGSYHAIWGSGPSDVYAVGSFGFFARYDGASWTEERGEMSRSFNVIHGSSPDNIWATGIDQQARTSFVVRLDP